MSNVKKMLLVGVVILATTFGAVAQKKGEKRQDRDDWYRELVQLKHDYLSEQLGLNEDEKTKFFALYDAMDNERFALKQQIDKEEKALEKKGAGATDAEYAALAEKLYRLKGDRNAIEMKYFKQFKTMLTGRQLYRLKKAEQEFNRTIRRHSHNNGK